MKIGFIDYKATESLIYKHALSKGVFEINKKKKKKKRRSFRFIFSPSKINQDVT